ncbi:MAG: Flp pilus assembly complex ATPase component TadA [Serpentinimonas sp.]|jgi:type II secretory ATPase GspE/PulE/Tfp pilus assembly ATPase PilB-like protein|nr:Flp pilus assembly complex ATPase component TadA [Serpentinimonas sp.]
MSDTTAKTFSGIPGAKLQPLYWPTPPYASYPSGPQGQALPCEVEGTNGHIRKCLLVSMSLSEKVAFVQVPPSTANMPLRFSMFRRITITEPLRPAAEAAPAEPQLEQDSRFVDELMNHRPRLHYHYTNTEGQRVEGTTVGHLETGQGVFLFHPLNSEDHVQRVFVPSGSLRDLHVGEAIGQVLVEQHAVTPQQVELAAREQEVLRNRKLGDYLVGKEIVKAEQLLTALQEQSKMPMVRIGEALTALGLITEEQLQDALLKQKTERSLPLGELLVQSGQLSRHDLQVALARKMGYPVVDVAQFPVDAEALRKVPHALAKRLKVLPLIYRDNLLVVAAEDPSSRSMIDELEFTIQTKVVAALATAPELKAAIAGSYAKLGLDSGMAGGMGRGGADAPGQEQEPLSAGKLLETLEMTSETEEVAEKPIEQSDNSLVRLINTMIIDAQEQGASDIHIETHPSKRKVRIRMRRDGKLKPYMELPHTYRSALVARIKIMCDLDISERRKPQDGKIEFGKFVPQHALELRVATIPTQGGAEDVVMRLLASAKPLPLEQLGMTGPNLQQLKHASERPYGMVLCVGPTGSGKTTTLHSVLQNLNTPDRKIWTAEDPVEITNPDLRQVQVNAKIDWTFAKALRAFLRADPDVIMVGEIRDHETAQMAIEASLTGHLVLSTLHTNSAPETIIRLLDMGIDPFNFADSLLAVLAQRLVRRHCKHCTTATEAPPEKVQELLEDFLHVFPQDLRPDPEALRAQWTEQFGREGKLMHYHAPGCKECDNTGFKGRLGLHELMSVDATIRRLIQTRGRPEELQHAAMAENGFRTLRQDGILKVLAGQTSIDEVRANCN